MSDLFAAPHKRFNPLTGEWILVSPHRLLRPWQGKTEEPAGATGPAYSPDCYLCPGNHRAGTERNPAYDSTFVFQNDFAALLPETKPAPVKHEDGLLIAQTEQGLCRVICFSPQHNLTLAEMELQAIEQVVKVWQQQYLELSALDGIRYVQIFENKGAIMGCSNPHPHGQIWASESVPVEPEKENRMQEAYYRKHGGRTLLGDYLETELRSGERLVCENQHWAALVPFWAKWPFETLLISRRPIQDMKALTSEEKCALADILSQLTVRYDNLFEVSFPYTMGFHQAPADGQNYPHWHLHAHFYPPLLRSATIQKFMVGYEMLATPQRDITAEAAAGRLRSASAVHFRKMAPQPVT